MKKTVLHQRKNTRFWTIGIGVGITLILLFICALLTKNGVLPEESQKSEANAVRLVSIFLISLLGYKSVENRNPIIYILIPVLCFLALVSLNLLLFDGKLQNVGSGSIYLVLGALGAVLCDSKAKTGKLSRKKRYRL